MNDWVSQTNRDRMQQARERNIKPGDFIGLLGDFSDVWHVVQCVWPDADALSAYSWRASRRYRTPIQTEYIFFHQITRHRKAEDRSVRGQRVITQDGIVPRPYDRPIVEEDGYKAACLPSETERYWRQYFLRKTKV